MSSQLEAFLNTGLLLLEEKQVKHTHLKTSSGQPDEKQIHE